MTYKLKARYLSKRERTSQKNNKKYYSISVVQGDQLQPLGVNEDLYNAADSLENLQEYWFTVSPSARSGGQYGAFLNVYCSGWEEADEEPEE